MEKNMDNKDIPAVIEQLLKTTKMTQEEIAKALGVSFTTLNRWKMGKIIPRDNAKRKILEMIEQVKSEEIGKKSRRTRRRNKEDVLSTKSMEQMLWDAACSIRGEKDASKFKDYILPLIFIKRLSDVFDDEVTRLTEKYGDQKTALSLIEADHSLVRFYLAPETRWDVVSRRTEFKWPKDKKPTTLGEQLTMTMRWIVKDNPSLSGVIDIIDYNEMHGGEREISDAALARIIEIFSDQKYRLGLYDVEPDFLGRAYEYLLRKFAEGQGQSAGEFFTPTEVGWLISYIVRPEQGEEVYDYACGSAGLLIKCELALQEKELKVKKPLKLYGQELTGPSYAIARMNMVIHDMEGEIVRGNSMSNPKFKDANGKLKKFDIVVANPMWNQSFDSKVFENDDFSRFETQGGITGSKADWAWLQHTSASLKANGRAGVVLDTGAVTRGSGSKNEDKEKTIRKWFVDNDLIEGVILLPDNLFYNTTAAGIIVFLNKAKPQSRKGKIILVNAGLEFKKGRPKNYMPDESIKKIYQAFIKGYDIEKFVKVISLKEAQKNDYNLSPSRYIDTSEKEIYRPIPEILKELKSLKKESAKIDEELDGIFKKLSKQIAKVK